MRANKDFDSLADAESVRFVILTGGLFRAGEEAFIQNRGGHLNTEAWEAVTRHYVLIMGALGIRRAWQMRKGGFDA